MLPVLAPGPAELSSIPIFLNSVGGSETGLGWAQGHEVAAGSFASGSRLAKSSNPRGWVKSVPRICFLDIKNHPWDLEKPGQAWHRWSNSTALSGI